MSKIIISIALIIAGLVIYSRGFTPLLNHLAFYPDRTDLIVREDLPDNVKEIFIRTKDNVKIRTYFIANQSSKELIIFFHGNAGNLGHRLPDLMQMSRSGINVLGVEYRGYGKSEGRASERGIYLDGQAAFDFATQRLGFLPKDIILFGRSIGSTVALNIAQNRELRGLILATPLTSAAEHAKVSGLRAISFLAGKAFNNIEKIDKVKCPLLIIHGTKDIVIPFSMGKQLFERAKTKKQFIEIEGANHNDLTSDFEQYYWPPILEFVGNPV